MSSRLSLLVDLSSQLAREVDLDQLLEAACRRVAEALGADRATVWLVDAATGDLVTRVAREPALEGARLPSGRGIAGAVAASGDTVRLDDAAGDARFEPSFDRRTGYVTRSVLAVALREQASAPVRGVLQVLNRREGPFDDDDARYLEALGAQLARALALTTLRAEDAGTPGLTLRGPFNGIVGTSAGLAEVYERVQLASQTDATVLLRGETGVGKGLFARAIHVNSARQAGPFTVVDCTTLPRELVESELFGHERGAFTGADRRVPGRVEVAHGGTLFLDEIGDLPLEAQGKLLRLVQDRTFERVGGRVPQTTDVRLVAATHRNLERLVREGRFREDLYFRLRVVEIVVPPLRARGAGEIESLARHFAERYARRYGRPAPRFGARSLELLRTHPWPGNVRELEHAVESAVVLAADGALDLAPGRPLASSPPASPGPGASGRPADVVALPAGLTLDAASRAYAEACLASAGGNRTEAARRLGISRNTLTRILGRARGGL